MRSAEEILKSKKQWQVISVLPTALVKEAVQKMVEAKVGSILVMENDKVFGIWTERDLLRHTINSEFSLATAVIGDYMTKDLHYARHSDSCYHLMDRALGLRIRHLLVEKEGKFLGLLSVGDVVKEILQEKFNELKAINAETSWNYYEEWKWKPE